MLLKVLAVVSMLAATLVCLTMLVLLMAGGANAKPSHITVLKWLMAGTGAVWLLGVGGGIWAMIAGRDGLAACLAAVPIVACIATFAVMWITEW